MICKKCGLKRQAGNYNLFPRNNRTYCRNCFSIIYTGKPLVNPNKSIRGKHGFVADFKQLARYQANRKLGKGNCVVCGVDNAQKHHEDYSKPFDVIYLCSTHHGARHRQKNRGGLLDLGALI